MSLRHSLFGALLALVLVAPASVAIAAETAAAPFVFSQSGLAPAPSRGWVVLLPGEKAFAFDTIKSHYLKVAALLNAQGFDTVIVPYQDAYNEDLDGDPDGDGERIAAVTLRAVGWMRQAHGVADNAPGALVAWAEGAQGLWTLAATGSKYPLADLVAAVAFYPTADDETLFDSRVPVLVQSGAQDDETRSLRHFLGRPAPGSVEPEFVVHDGATRGFDVEKFAKPKTVRRVPLIGATTTLAYNAAVAGAAEQKMLTFLKARLEAPE